MQLKINQSNIYKTNAENFSNSNRSLDTNLKLKVINADTFQNSPIAFNGMSPQGHELLNILEENKPDKISSILSEKIKTQNSSDNFEELINYMETYSYPNTKIKHYENLLKAFEKNDSKNKLMNTLYTNLGNAYWDRATADRESVVALENGIYDEMDKETAGYYIKAGKMYGNALVEIINGGEKIDTSNTGRINRAEIFCRLADVHALKGSYKKSEKLYKIAMGETVNAFNSTNNTDERWEILAFLKLKLNKIENFSNETNSYQTSYEASDLRYDIDEMNDIDSPIGLDFEIKDIEKLDPFNFNLDGAICKKFKHAIGKIFDNNASSKK